MTVKELRYMIKMYISKNQYARVVCTTPKRQMLYIISVGYVFADKCELIVFNKHTNQDMICENYATKLMHLLEPGDNNKVADYAQVTIKDTCDNYYTIDGVYYRDQNTIELMISEW